MYVIEAFSERKRRILDRNFSKRNETTYYLKADKRTCDRWQRKLARRGIDSRVFPEKYNRSSDYRKIYFDAHPEQDVYRCVYCGYTFYKSLITIDHVIPVDAAKKYSSARLALKLRGCDDVNDLNNLVPACFKCNKKKGTSWNIIYLIRAKYGHTDTYWRIVRTLRIIFSIIVLIVIAVLINKYCRK